MKRNLIIFLFTLLLGGITCCNYSYASTVNVSESFCKNIQNNYASLETDNEINAMLDDFCKSNPCTDSQKALMRESYSSSKSHYQDEWGNENKEKIKEVCNAATGCMYFHEKCVACPGIRLNTDIPFIGNCIPTDSQSEIFPVFIGGLIKFATSLLLLVGFICIIVGGVMVACGKDKEGKDLIKKVVYAMALLGASGVILKMINPNFFN